MRGFVEPPENELRRMLEARERNQEIARQGLWKRGSKVILMGFAVLLVVSLAFPQVRDLIATIAREYECPTTGTDTCDSLRPLKGRVHCLKSSGCFIARCKAPRM